MAVAKEQIRQMIADNSLSSVTDVYTFLRDGFKDILKELMEAEMDVALGYEKNQKGDMETFRASGHTDREGQYQSGNHKAQHDVGTGKGNA